jgi:DNA repair protein RecO (recombination protein O)
MTRNSNRIDLMPGYILHHRPYRDTSRILEVVTRHHGRLSLFAYGVRGAKAKLASTLLPFQLLLLSWSGNGEAVHLTGAENAQVAPPLPPSCLMGGFYMNELLMKLTTRYDPLPSLFDSYHEALENLRNGEPLEPELRIFEKRLLEALGYGLDLGAESQTGTPIASGEYYHFHPEQGLVAATAKAPGAFAGHSLIALAQEQLTGEHELQDARRLLQTALAQCLDGRPLATSAVAHAVAIARRESQMMNDSEP